MDKKYKSIYSKNGLEVFVNPEDFWVDYKQLQIHQKHAFNQKQWHEKI